MKARISNLIFFLLTLCFTNTAQVPVRNDVLNTVKKVADNVLKNATFLYYDQATGIMIDDIQKYGYNRNVVPQSSFNRWKYANGVMHIAFNALGEVVKEERYINYPKKNFEFFFKDYNYFKSIYKGESKHNFPLGHAIVLNELDDCGAMGASLIELYNKDKKTHYKEFIDRATQHIMTGQMRLEDGTLSRHFPEFNTVWADDLYMSVPFLARIGKLTGDNRYFDEAVKQVILFNKHLYDEKNDLFWHCYYGDLNQVGGTFWARCNGWVMVATADLLKFLPENHSKRGEIIALLNRQIRGIAQYQSQSGLWHQVLHKSDSYLETSSTAMFTYSVALAVNNGWVDQRYKTIAFAGWQGVSTHITPEGGIENICMGTGIGNDIKFYYDRPIIYNDFHGIGAVILAGVEVSKLLSQ